MERGLYPKSAPAAAAAVAISRSSTPRSTTNAFVSPASKRSSLPRPEDPGAGDPVHDRPGGYPALFECGPGEQAGALDRVADRCVLLDAED